MSNQWFVRDNGKNIGPMTAADLQQQAHSGAISPETPIRNGVEGTWFRADRIPGLFGRAVNPSSAEVGGPLDAIDVDTPRAVPSAIPPRPRPVPAARPAAPADIDPPMAEPVDPLDFDAVGGAGTPSPHGGPMMRKKSTSPAKPLAFVGGGIGFAVAFAVAYAVSTGAVQSLFSGSVESQLKATETEMNKTLPKEIDPVTRLIRVQAGPGKMFTFIYTVTMMDIPPDMKTALQQNGTSKSLANPALKPVFDAGVTVTHSYLNPAGTNILEFSIKR